MKKNKGITLIALIITIIILIILTAVTINNVIGTDLIGFATRAAENYMDAGEKEQSMIDDIGSAAKDISTSLTGGSKEEELKEKIYSFEVELDADKSTGTDAIINVSKVKNDKTSEEVEEGLTYTYYLEDTEKETNENKTYTYTGLDQTKSYNMKVRVKDSDNNYGEASIRVISFSIEYMYYRCTDGDSWTDIVSVGCFNSWEAPYGSGKFTSANFEHGMSRSRF